MQRGASTGLFFYIISARARTGFGQNNFAKKFSYNSRLIESGPCSNNTDTIQYMGSFDDRTISGRERLKSLEAEHRYVFHGSGNPRLIFLEPRQAYSWVGDKKKKDDKPAIHASPFSDIAIFMGLINEKNCPQGLESEFSYDGEELHFSASQRSLDQLDDKGAKGYVYVFAQKDFLPRDRYQFISHHAVKPLFVIEIEKADLPGDIEIKVENKAI